MPRRPDRSTPAPTDRELAILEVLWDLGEGSVRQVHEQLREQLPIVQNTVQAFLRTMEAKGLVTHRAVGRSFVYAPVADREPTQRRLLSRLLERVFDGAMDELVESALSVRPPTPDEIERLRALVAAAEAREASGEPADDGHDDGAGPAAPEAGPEETP